MSSGEALISFPIVSPEVSPPVKSGGNQSSEGRGECLSGTLSLVILQYPSPPDDSGKRGAVVVGLELQSAGQRGGCAVDKGDQLPEWILYTKVDYGAHHGGGQNSRDFHLDCQPSDRSYCNTMTFLCYIKAN